MDLLKVQLARLQQQLSGLTASQKMLAGTLVAIMAMTLFWWARYAGDPEMEPLLNQSFSQSDISQITTHLSEKQIKYTLAGDKILIPADRKIEVLADLGFAHLLPSKTDTGFDEIVKNMTPWDSNDKNQRMWTEAKQRTLAQVIGGFPNVDHAVVVIDPHDERRFDGHDVVPSGMVTIFTRDHAQGRKIIKQLAMAAADVISGAEAGLSPGRVTVVVDGATIPIADKNSDGFTDGDSIVEAIQDHEEMFRKKIESQLGFINGLFVSVRVDLNTKKTETERKTVDSKNPIHLTSSEMERDTETPVGSTPSGEPGANPNVANAGLVVGGASAGSGGGTATDNDTKTTYQNDYGLMTEHIVQGPGDAPPVSASVRVPRSYFIAMYKDVNRGKDPDDTALAALTKKELDTIRQDVKSCTGIKADEAVTVNWYSDGVPSAVVPVTQAASTPVSLLLGAHGKEMGVGVLALVSLFMVMMMVRKSAPAPMPVMAGAVEKPIPGRLKTGTDLAGEVAEGDPMMDGMELDDESAKTQQMVNQVSSMVSENPDAAAALVKRWLNRA